MTNQYHVVTPTDSEYGMNQWCKFCGDKIVPSSFCLEVFDPATYDAHQPYYWRICKLCALEKAPELAKLVFLAEAAESYANRGVSAHISEAMKKRESDPEWLKKKLQVIHQSFASHGHSSPLAGFVAEHITVALESGNVEAMQQAKQLFDDSASRWVGGEELTDIFPL